MTGRPVCRCSLYLNPRRGGRISHFSRGALIFQAAAFQKKGPSPPPPLQICEDPVCLQAEIKRRGDRSGAARVDEEFSLGSRLLNEEQLKRERRPDRRGEKELAEG